MRIIINREGEKITVRRHQSLGRFDSDILFEGTMDEFFIWSIGNYENARFTQKLLDPLAKDINKLNESETETVLLRDNVRKWKATAKEYITEIS